MTSLKREMDIRVRVSVIPLLQILSWQDRQQRHPTPWKARSSPVGRDEKANLPSRDFGGAEVYRSNCLLALVSSGGSTS